MEKSLTYHGLLYLLVREKTVYLWACSADGNYNLDSDEILWHFDCQTSIKLYCKNDGGTLCSFVPFVKRNIKF